MHDTSVPNLSVWSGPAAPLCCLANKSQARLCSESLQSALEANLNGPGSMIYQTVWKPHTTPLGRQIYRLRASARRTSDSEPSLVRSGWPTPMAGTPAQNGNNEAGNNDSSRKTVALSGWPTPTLGSPNSLRGHGQEPSIRKAGGHSVNLQDMVRLSGWPTPMAADNRDRGSWDDPAIQRRKRIGKSIELSMLVGCAHGAARITADGTMLTGCSAGMESGGQLNPAFSGWLQGFPEAWCRAAISCQLPARLRKAPKKPAACCACVGMAMQLCRKPQRCLSRRLTRPSINGNSNPKERNQCQNE